MPAVPQAWSDQSQEASDFFRHGVDREVSGIKQRHLVGIVPEIPIRVHHVTSQRRRALLVLAGIGRRPEITLLRPKNTLGQSHRELERRSSTFGFLELLWLKQNSTHLLNKSWRNSLRLKERPPNWKLRPGKD